ncbi:TPA_asm: hypothetical protein GBZ67_21115 [Salmonella enterica subsp. diarizonae]|nr:hypothetical protein [Salmonella enterica subsp. diarizonae]ELI2367694.1 hypothetical protein [Salmonella enterica]HAB1616830.1 hypothetical protein [Salmonella enterica subsp. diarizonae]
MNKKLLITAMSFSMAGCAGMKFPDYSEVKTSPYYAECREFAADVYKNDGYSKLANTVILSMDDLKAKTIVTGCVVAMGKSNFDEIKSDINNKAISYGIMSGTCTTAVCKVDTEQQMKAYDLGSYYASTKKFPNQMKPEF